MNYRIIIRREAESDLANGFDWYEERRDGLGLEFLNEVKALLTKIAANPERHPTGYKQTRMGFPKRFPYRVIYFFEQDRVEVIGVVHVRRAPRSWHQRV